MLYSSNRVHHLYVVSKVETTKTHLDDTDEVGTILPKLTREGELYFEYRGPGGILRTDLVNLSRIDYKRVQNGVKDSRPLDSRIIKLADVTGKGVDATNSPTSDQVIPGQNYLLSVKFGNWIGMDELDNYFTQASVTGTEGMTNSDFYVKMAYSLALNLSTMADPLIRIILLTEGDTETTEIDIKNRRVIGKVDTLLANGNTYTGILIRERIDPVYVQGKGEEVPINISVQRKRVVYNEHAVDWCNDYAEGVADADRIVYGVGSDGTMSKAQAMPNGRRTADLEYWCMGERGDQERHLNWPNNVDTTYLVKPEHVYDYLNIHFFWAGHHEEVQKSERDMTIVAPHYSDLTAATESGLMKSLKTAIETVTSSQPDSKKITFTLADTTGTDTISAY